MDDRTRILTEIAASLSSTILLGRSGPEYIYRDYEGKPHAQFVGTHRVKPQPGDIVKCATQMSPKWKFAVFLEDCGGGNGGYWLLREIGGKRTVRMFNEMISVLVGMHKSDLYEGQQRRLYEAANKAFYKRYNKQADRYAGCFGGADFEGDVMRIWVRAHAFAYSRREDGKESFAQPWSFWLKWSTKTRLKHIVAALNEAGFPRPFEYAETQFKQPADDRLI